LLLDYGKCPAGDWKSMLATREVFKSDPIALQDLKPQYPYKAFGLFRLYDCFRKDKKAKHESYEYRVFSNQTVVDFLKEESKSRFSPDYMARVQMFLDKRVDDNESDIYEPSIELAKEFKFKKMPSDRLSVLKESLQLA
jgi:hypothetical protein